MFPSPQVGSERWRVIGGSGVLLGFHPLKSGRNPIKLPPHPGETDVSIPSSRVGTGVDVRLRGRATTSFHPLKSGRNRFAYQLSGALQIMFPSPQVGSELAAARAELRRLRRFPSPQVGSEQRQ